MTLKGVSLPAVTVAGVGGLFIWSGLHGASVTAVLRSLISGQKPSGANINPIRSPATTTAAGGTIVAGQTGSAIADDALKYQGMPYKWGGSSPSGSDCSGFVNMVIGRDLGDPIPTSSSGRYSGHGPVTAQWFIWNGAQTIPAAQMRAGDLCCWLTHMGIAVSGTEMISALDPQLGTVVTTIAGGSPGSEPFRVRRLR